MSDKARWFLPTAALSGLLFGLGLTVSGMIYPSKVIGFLDITGDWDPSLILVMAAAIPVAALGMALGRRRPARLCASAFAPSIRTAIDHRLLLGAALFGTGWGLVGFCPGPALAALGFVDPKNLLFVAAMLVGMGGFEVWDRRKT